MHVYRNLLLATLTSLALVALLFGALPQTQAAGSADPEMSAAQPGLQPVGPFNTFNEARDGIRFWLDQNPGWRQASQPYLAVNGFWYVYVSR